MTNNKRSVWKPVKDYMGEHEFAMGKHHTYHFYRSPRRILHFMSYYKFAAKMIDKKKQVLDFGCGEGMGTWLLAKECGKAKGVDLDYEAIEVAKNNWRDKRISFECINFFDMKNSKYDAVVSFDVIEHILPKSIGKFWKKAKGALKKDGIVIIGTQNITADKYASKITKVGHVNLYSGERLEREMRKHFKQVFMFGANDEVIHTGFLPMAHYLLAVGVGVK